MKGSREEGRQWERDREKVREGEVGEKGKGRVQGIEVNDIRLPDRARLSL